MWQRLESWLNTASLARALDLKWMLTNISVGIDQSMDVYLCAIKSIADAFAAIQSLVSDSTDNYWLTRWLGFILHDFLYASWSYFFWWLGLSCCSMNNAWTLRKIIFPLYIRCLLTLLVLSTLTPALSRMVLIRAIRITKIKGVGVATTRRRIRAILARALPLNRCPRACLQVLLYVILLFHCLILVAPMLRILTFHLQALLNLRVS